MTAPPPALPASLDRLLILRMSALGDIVNALYTLPILRRRYPRARIGWVVDDRFRDLLDCVPDVDEVIAFPRRRWGGALRNPLRWPAVAWQARGYLRDLRGRGYEAVIDLQGNVKSAFHLWGAGIPLRVGFDADGSREGAHRFADVRVPGPPPRVLRAEKFLRLLRGVGLDTSAPAVRFRTRPEDDADVDRFLDTSGLTGRRFAVLHPGVSAFGSYKRWPTDRFAALARRLASEGLPVVATWGPGERVLAESVTGASLSPVSSSGSATASPIRVSLETRPIGRLIALLRRASVFVGNDSGPLHLAAACGTPVVGLYGPKDPGVYGPFSTSRAVLYHPLPCSPCGRRRCGFVECMSSIPAEDVAARVGALLGGAPDVPDCDEPLRGSGGPGRLAVEAAPPVPGPLRRFRVGDWMWESVPETAGPLAAAARRSPAGLPGTEVRTTGRRRFLRAELPASDGAPGGGEGARKAFVKVYPIRKAGSILRSAIGCSQAEVEFHRLMRLHAAGAPVPQPLALGRAPGTQAVVLEDLGGTTTVRDFLQGALEIERGGTGRGSGIPPAARMRLHEALAPLMRDLAAAAARLHGAGFAHADLHLGNLLRSPDGALHVVDVHRGRESRTLSLRARALSLAHLCFSLSPFVSVSSRVRLLREYADRARLGRTSVRPLVAEVDRALGRLRRRYARRQAARARRGGSAVRVGGWEGGRAYAHVLLWDALSGPETVESVLKEEGGRRVLRARKGIASGTVRLAIKEDTRSGRGLRAWMGAHALLACGLPTPQPYFLVERSGMSRLATLWIEGAEPVGGYVESRLGGGAAAAWRRECAWRLGRFVRRLHATGVYHADLKAGNVLAQDDARGRTCFFVLDLDRIATYPGCVPRGRELRNLAQLNAAIASPVTRADRLRCFLAYAARDRELRKGWKSAVRRVMRMTRARHHRWP